jgi:hypothetical protein
MGQIAVDDNPTVGTKIVSILNCDIAKVAQILADFTASTVSSSISSTYSGLSSSTRFKRDTGLQTYFGICWSTLFFIFTQEKVIKLTMMLELCW